MNRQQTPGDKINEGQKWQSKRKREKHFISMTLHICECLSLSGCSSLCVEVVVVVGGEGWAPPETTHEIVHEWRFCPIDCGNNDTWLCWGGCWLALEATRLRWAFQPPPSLLRSAPDWLDGGADAASGGPRLGAGWSLSTARVKPSVWASLPGSSSAGGLA